MVVIFICDTTSLKHRIKPGDLKNFTTRVVLYNVPNFFKFSETDFPVLSFNYFQFGQRDFKLSFRCGMVIETSNCLKLVIGIKMVERDKFLVKFYDMADDLGDYKNWKRISVFEVNQLENWIILFDDFNGFFIFGTNYCSSTLANEKIDSIGKVPNFKEVPIRLNKKLTYCISNSTLCPDPDAEYDAERTKKNSHVTKSNDLIYIAILGLLALFTVAMMMRKLCKDEI